MTRPLIADQRPSAPLARLKIRMWTWRCGSGASWPFTGRAAEWRLKRQTGVADIGSAPRAPRRASGSSSAKVDIPVVAAPWTSSSSSVQRRVSWAAAAAANSTDTDFGTE